MKKTLSLLFCASFVACSGSFQQIAGSWMSKTHYEVDSVNSRGLSAIEAITVYEFRPDSTYLEHHYAEGMLYDKLERSDDNLRYSGTWSLTNDTLAIHKSLKELSLFFSRMDTTIVDEHDTLLIQHLDSDSLIAKLKFYNSLLDWRAKRVKPKN